MGVQDNHSKFWFVADLVDVVVEQLVDEVDVREEHAAAAVAIEAQLIQDLAHVHLLSRVAVLVTLSHQQAELLPLVRDYLAAAEAPDRNDHLLIIINTISQSDLNQLHPRVAAVLFPAADDHALLLQLQQVRKGGLEHVALQVEEVVALHALQVVYLLVVAHLQRLLPLLRRHQLEQALLDAQAHFFAGLEGNIDEKGVVMEAGVRLVLGDVYREELRELAGIGIGLAVIWCHGFEQIGGDGLVGGLDGRDHRQQILCLRVFSFCFHLFLTGESFFPGVVQHDLIVEVASRIIVDVPPNLMPALFLLQPLLEPLLQRQDCLVIAINTAHALLQLDQIPHYILAAMQLHHSLPIPLPFRLQAFQLQPQIRDFLLILHYLGVDLVQGLLDLLPVPVVLALVELHELGHCLLQFLHLALDHALQSLLVEPLLYLHADFLQFLRHGLGEILAAIGDDLVDGADDEGLHVRHLFLLLYVGLDEAALLEQLFVVFVEFVIEGGDGELALFQLLHEVLDLRLEGVAHDFVDLLGGVVFGPRGGVVERAEAATGRDGGLGLHSRLVRVYSIRIWIQMFRAGKEDSGCWKSF